jgi:NNP family nitrate/nitrite transporter-like MFS transporter
MISDQPTTARGHVPTVIASFLHFDVSFMLWVLIGALGIPIAESLHLSPSGKAFVVALPILAGALLRVPLGLLSDRWGGRRVGIAMLAALFVPLAIGWRAGDSLPALLAAGALLGVAGASFAVALPLASQWYPARRQGLVMGVAAAGNSGTVLANLLAPRLAAVVGWQNVFGLAMIPLAVVLLAFALMARDCPTRPRPQPLRGYLAAAARGDLWWFCLFYAITFGGYVGLGSFLPLFLRDQFALTPVRAGLLAAMAAFTGSAMRPVGGWIADRIGGTRLLSFSLVAIAAVYTLVGQLGGLGPTMTLVVLGMACFGLGNGAVFQLVPQSFAGEIGVATGVVGAVGGLGGFVLPMLLGTVRQHAGTYGPGFVLLGALAVAGLVALRVLAPRRPRWRPRAVVLTTADSLEGA